MEATNELRYAKHRSEDGTITTVLQQKFESDWFPFAEWRNVPIVSVTPNGCGAKLAPGQHWAVCGETDMGQTSPALCTRCGGVFLPEP
jgi:hypothetical protein